MTVMTATLFFGIYAFLSTYRNSVCRDYQIA